MPTVYSRPILTTLCAIRKGGGMDKGDEHEREMRGITCHTRPGSEAAYYRTATVNLRKLRDFQSLFISRLEESYITLAWFLLIISRAIYSPVRLSTVSLYTIPLRYTIPFSFEKNSFSAWMW